MRLSSVIRELNAREMHRYRTREARDFTGNREVQKRDPDRGWLFVCWAHPIDVRSVLEGMGKEYAPLIERLDREGLS